MSFVYGGVRSDGLAGVHATLTAWPSLGGLTLETEDKVGKNGRFFGGVARTHSEFTFDVIIQGSTPQEVFDRRDNFVGLLDPSRGARSLVVEFEKDWVFPEVVVASGVDWERLAWGRDIGFSLRAEVVFETVGPPEARQAEPQVMEFAGSTSFTLTAGNTASFPRITFDASSAASAADFVVKIGDFSVKVSAGFPSGHRADLDYENFEFYRTNAAGARQASIVSKLSHFERPVLNPGESVTVSVTGASGKIRFYPNARRI